MLAACSQNQLKRPISDLFLLSSAMVCPIVTTFIFCQIPLSFHCAPVVPVLAGLLSLVPEPAGGPTPSPKLVGLLSPVPEPARGPVSWPKPAGLLSIVLSCCLPSPRAGWAPPSSSWPWLWSSAFPPSSLCSSLLFPSQSEVWCLPWSQVQLRSAPPNSFPLFIIFGSSSCVQILFNQ